MVVRARGGLAPETTRRLLGVLRSAELATLPNPAELAVMLPNTDPDGASAVERRVREVLPDAEVGLATREPGDGIHDLLQRAREAGSP